jgi:hypothetical protein
MKELKDRRRNRDKTRYREEKRGRGGGWRRKVGVKLQVDFDASIYVIL